MIRGVNAVATVGGQSQLSIDQCSWDQIQAALRQRNGPKGNGQVTVTVQSHDFYDFTQRRGSDLDTITANAESFMKCSKFFFDRSSG